MLQACTRNLGPDPEGATCNFDVEVIGKGLGWEFAWVKEYGGEVESMRLPVLADFVEAHTGSNNLLQESFLLDREKDPGNQEQTAWWVWGMLRAYPRSQQIMGQEPAVRGIAEVGKTLTADAGEWSPSDVELSYQWYANGTAIYGQTASTLVVPDSVLGKKITVRVSGSKPGYDRVLIESVQTAAVVEAGTTPVDPVDAQVKLEASSTAVKEGASVALRVGLAEQATGTVEFFDGAQSLGSLPVEGGAATKQVTALSVGTHVFTAKYSGDEAYLAATTESVSVVVAANPVAHVTLGTPKFLTSSQPFNAVTARRAQVSVTVKGTLAGAVEFTANGKVLGRAGIVRSGTEGVATLLLPAKLAVGNYSRLTARLVSGSTTVVSAAGEQTFTVVKASTKKVKVKAKKFARGTNPKIKVTVTKLSNGRVATGKLLVRIGGKTVKTVKINAKKKGKVSFRLKKKYFKSVKVRVRFVPKSKATTLAKWSKRVTLKAK